MNIYEVPKERRYWVVRAEGGKYYDHFINHGLIALSHINCLKLAETPDGEVFLPELKELCETFKGYYTVVNSTKQRTSVHLAQVKSFTYEMSVGDWVITVGSHTVRFGRITSSAFIKKDLVSIIYDHETGRKVDMDFNLRRKVQWGPTLVRKFLPYGLIRSLKANQTVFSLDKSWQAVYHTLYPAFQKEGKLYLSAKITAEDNIKNYNVTSIFNLLNEIEVIGKEFTESDELKDFDDVFNEYIDKDKLTTTTKAQFHSAGDIWNTITTLGSGIHLENWMLYTVVSFSMLFGNNKMGFDGLIGKETRDKLWDLVIDRIKENKAEKVVDSLQLKMPNSNTKEIEGSSNDEP